VAYPANGLVFGKVDSSLTLNIHDGINIKECQYFNNSLSWTNAGDSGQLILYRSFNGLRVMVGIITVQDQESHVQAFFRRPSATPAALALHYTLARPAVAAAAADDVKITTTSIPAGVSNRDYPVQTLAASGGSGTYTWKSDNLPAGLSLSSSDGKLSGIPTLPAGSYDFYVTVADTSSSAKTAKAVLTLMLVDPLKITTTSLPDAISDQQYRAYLNAQGGDPDTYSWEITPKDARIESGGTLTLDGKTGCISGKPSVPAGSDNVASFSVKVTSTVAGVTLENETHLTIKMVAVFSPTLILSIISGILSLLVGTGVTFKVIELRQKAKEAAEKAQQDPENQQTFEKDLENVTQEYGNFLEESAKTSLAKQQDWGDLQKAVAKAKEEYESSIVKEYGNISKSLTSLLHLEQSRRQKDQIELEKKIGDLEAKIKGTVDQSIKDALEKQKKEFDEKLKAEKTSSKELTRAENEEGENEEGLEEVSEESVLIPD
jgi:hypothetical protein